MDDYVWAEAIAGFSELVEDLEGNPRELLRQAHLEPDEARWDGLQFPFETAAQLLEEAASKLRCPDFGMRLGDIQDGTQIMRALAPLVRNAPTFGSATRAVILRMDLLSSAIRERIEYDASKGMFALRLDVRTDASDCFPQFTEKALLLMHTSAIKLTGGRVRSREVWFGHSQVSKKANYRSRFGCAVQFDQEYDAVFFTDMDLRSKIVGGNPALYNQEKMLASYLDAAGAIPFTRIVEEAIKDSLRSNQATCEEVSDALGLTPRNLNRKLNNLGTNFERLRDKVRKKLALKYLSSKRYRLTDVAAKVGYSELAVLSRSCNRWFGKPPGKVRQTILAEPAARQESSD